MIVLYVLQLISYKTVKSQMELALTLSLGTIISILTFSGKMLYGTANLTNSGITTMHSGPSQLLVERCGEIIEDLQQMDHTILITRRSHRLVQTIIDSLNWAKSYDKKCTLKKIIFNGSYSKKFETSHERITRYFYDLVLSVQLTRAFPDVPSPKSSTDVSTGTTIFAPPDFIDKNKKMY